MQNKKFWKLVAIIEFVIIVAISIYYFSLEKESFAPGSFTVSPDKANKKYGKCLSTLPMPLRDSNYIKVLVSLKGSDLAISEFEWNDSNYVSHPGCFKLNADKTEHTFSNYMYHAKEDSLVPFYIKLRTRSNDNNYEFSLKAFNLKNELIGKYPEVGESLKTKIDFIGIPAVLTENIKLKN